MVAFAPGSLPVDGRAPILQMFHDSSKVIGTVVERQETSHSRQRQQSHQDEIGGIRN
jgi:hypothetical protein